MSTKRPRLMWETPSVTVIATEPPPRRGVLTELGFWLLLSVAFCVAAVVLAATYLVGVR